MEPNPILNHIEIDPRVCNGKPVVRGTRIPVTIVLEQLSRGESWESVLAGYPELTRSDLEAVMHYAKAAVENSELTFPGVK